METSIFLASNVTCSQEVMHWFGLHLNVREAHVDLPTFNAELRSKYFSSSYKNI